MTEPIAAGVEIAATDILVSDEMTWDEYKVLLNDATPNLQRITLIEKYLSVSPEQQARGVTLGQLRMSAVLSAFTRLMQGAANPNA